MEEKFLLINKRNYRTIITVVFFSRQEILSLSAENWINNFDKGQNT